MSVRALWLACTALMVVAGPTASPAADKRELSFNVYRQDLIVALQTLLFRSFQCAEGCQPRRNRRHAYGAVVADHGHGARGVK